MRLLVERNFKEENRFFNDWGEKCDEEMYEVAMGVNDEAFTFCGLACLR